MKSSKSLLIINNSKKMKRERYKILYIQSYKQNYKFLFITYLYNDRNK